MIVKTKWWKNPLKWVDIEQLEIIRDVDDNQRHDAIALIVYEFLRDRGTSRPEENKVFKSIFIQALNGVDLNYLTMTTKQKRTMRLFRDALSLKKIPSHHIAEQESITVRSANRRLQTLDMKAKTVHSADLLTIERNNPQPFYAPIPLNKIRQVQKRLRVRCAGDGLQDCWGHARGDIGVCPSCYAQAKLSDWLEEHRKFVLRESYAEAKAIIERGSDNEYAAVAYERIANAA